MFSFHHLYVYNFIYFKYLSNEFIVNMYFFSFIFFLYYLYNMMNRTILTIFIKNELHQNIFKLSTIVVITTLYK